MKAIDCFSGCGGLSEGLRQAKFQIVAGIEIREPARDAHKLNHPEAELYTDITKVRANTLLADLRIKKGELDLLAGCPPCQGFSTMRTLNGAERIRDPRNDLIFDFIRLARGLLPKTVLIENVPALQMDWRLKAAKKSLRRAGYKWIKSDVLNAADFGVPQRRRRMILMASRIGPIELPAPKESTKGTTVRQAIGGLEHPRFTTNRLHKLYMRHSAEVLQRIKAIPKNGGSRLALGKRHQLPCHKRLNGFKDVYGRMEWDEVSPTITRFCHNPSKGRFLHPRQNRAITIYEALRLQSFPAGYKFPQEQTMTEIASLIGEALPPKFAKAQGRHIAAHLVLHKRKKRTKCRKTTSTRYYGKRSLRNNTQSSQTAAGKS